MSAHADAANAKTGNNTGNYKERNKRTCLKVRGTARAHDVPLQVGHHNVAQRRAERGRLHLATERNTSRVFAGHRQQHVTRQALVRTKTACRREPSSRRSIMTAAIATRGLPDGRIEAATESTQAGERRRCSADIDALMLVVELSAEFVDLDSTCLRWCA